MDSSPPSSNRSRTRRCGPKLADALAYSISDSESERAAAAEQSPEQDLVAEHLPLRSVSVSLGLPSSISTTSVELLPDRSAIEMSPGRTDSLDLSLGRAASLDLSFGLEASKYLTSRPRTATSLHLSGRDATPEMSTGKASSLHNMRRDASMDMPPGRDTAPEISPGRGTSLQTAPGVDTTPKISPGRGTSLQLAPVRDTTSEMSPGRVSSLHNNMSAGRDAIMDMSHGRARPPRMSPEEASSFDLSSGQTASPCISLRRSKLLGRNASHQSAEQASSVDLSTGQEKYFGKSSGRSTSLNLSPDRVTSFEVSPKTETLTRQTASNYTLSEDGSQHKRNFSRTPSDAGKIHLSTTQRMDHGISDIGSPEPATPFSFGAMPLPAIKASRHEKECRLDMKKTEKEKRKVGKESAPIKASREQNKYNVESTTPQEERRKEKELRDIKAILENQMKIFDKRRVTGNDMRILSRHRNVESIPLAKKENIKVAVKNKILPKHVPVPPKAPKTSSQTKRHIIVRETTASKIGKIVQNEQPVVTRKVLPSVKSPINPPARPIRVHNAPGRSFFSPLPSSRSSSESPPPTPKKDGPPRPDCVPSLDLSFLLSPEDYPSGAPIPPPVFAVRETKASKLRRQKKKEEEKNAKSQGKKDKSRDVEWEHSLESIQRTRTPTQTFKPYAPKAYKKPVLVTVKETKASKLRFKLPEIKKGNRK